MLPDKKVFALMKIYSLRISRLQNEEWFRFHTEFVELAIACGIELLRIVPIFPLYHTLYMEADSLFEVRRKSFYTRDTALANRLRCDMFRSLRDSTRSQLHLFTPADRAAAERVYAVIAKYKHPILKGSQPAGTAATDNLLQDLTSATGGSARMAQDVERLGLGRWVNGLHTANENYKESLARRMQEAAVRPPAGRLRELRRKTDFYYIHMIVVVNACLLTIPDTAGGDRGKILHFARQLNSCTARYRALLKGRRTRKNNETSWT